MHAYRWLPVEISWTELLPRPWHFAIFVSFMHPIQSGELLVQANAQPHHPLVKTAPMHKLNTSFHFEK